MAKQNRDSHPSRACRWLRLALALALLYLLAFGLLPRLDRLPCVAAIQQCIRDREIQADALFYTESKEASDAEFYLRHALREQVEQLAQGDQGKERP